MLLLEGTAPAKAGGEGAQGSREPEPSYNVFFASSCPGPPPPSLCPDGCKGLGWGCLESAPGSTTCRGTASLSAQLPSLSASAPGGSSPVPHYLQSGTHCPMYLATAKAWGQRCQSQSPLPLARTSGPRMSTWPGRRAAPSPSDGQGQGCSGNRDDNTHDVKCLIQCLPWRSIHVTFCVCFIFFLLNHTRQRAQASPGLPWHKGDTEAWRESGACSPPVSRLLAAPQ